MNKNKFHKSWRLKGYDYSQSGAYFITIVSQYREMLFGEVIDGEMILNDAGKMVRDVWLDLPGRFKGLILDEFVVMPDHFHGILIINDDEQENDQAGIRPSENMAGTSPASTRDSEFDSDSISAEAINSRNSVGTSPTSTGPTSTGPTSTIHRAEYSISEVIGAFKSITSVKYIQGVKDQRLNPFEGKIWQPGFYDRIIRDDGEYDRLQEYINQNPMRWDANRTN